MVIITVATPSTTEGEKGRKVITSASFFAKLWDADAEVKKPDRVTPI